MYVIFVNVAVTARAEFTVMMAGLVDPPRSPLHPVKVEPAAGVAVKITDVLYV
jgi:hypothetical protein